MAESATQRIPYTDRDRAWDAVADGAVTSTPEHWNCFVDSVLAAIEFARAALHSAVWAHTRGEKWDWFYSPPGRVEDKYERWGDGHPYTYDIESDAELMEAMMRDHAS